ncbi:MAG: bifunctional diaminohydroxyphosphoribosylaminopyrimidine deaminase/5-amino-6-(5-phosphoribosylamino)uracil reductase RibD [Bacillota bacterium]|nr:bifunctional diaminohydroxyphosphoribosylaminopyrimidine deaminase/5-amino-6-(5-phosphoribosylamino)uracil reductase RibD [Bacillota bacterium]
MDADDRYMWMALDLARQGRGRTSPNPMVGAVVVQGSEVLATGYHQAAGTPHAEIIALKKAGEKAEGATLYLNLEPCAHHGRTGPCTEAIIKAGISRVVAAMQDPNPLVSGRGFARLTEAGIKVKEGVLEQKARQLNEVFIKYITEQLPFVSVKVAMSLDGKIGTATGDSQWITGDKARQFVHRLRDNTDVIMVGIETVLKDNPRLTTRIEGGGGKDPVKVVVDSTARLPLDARVIESSSSARLILAVTEQASKEKLRALKDRGVEVLVMPAKEGRVDLKALMKKLAERELSAVLVEGGGTLNYSLLEQSLIDKLFIFIAPLIIGGRESPTAFSGVGVEKLASAWSVEDVELKQFDKDLLLIGYPVLKQ